MTRPRRKRAPHGSGNPQSLTQLETRLEKIETKCAYLEDFLARLQGAVLDGNRVLDLLQGEHRVMKDRLLQMSQEWETLPHKKPPHY